MRQWLTYWLKWYCGKLVYRRALSAASNRRFREKTADLVLHDQPLWAVSADMFTYHGEDGILAWLIGQFPGIPKQFADLGSGDCIKSNCARLVVHEQWEGVFADMNGRQLALGKRFYSRLPGVADRVQFIQEKISVANCNRLLREAGLSGETGLLSVDIDGNDIWIWEAIDCIQPKIVVIEAKVEFGLAALAVPYGPANHVSVSNMYNGASVEAFIAMGRKKGYTLVGANRQGYNLFFIRNPQPLREATASEVLQDPETRASFYGEDFFTQHTFINVS